MSRGWIFFDYSHLRQSAETKFSNKHCMERQQKISHLLEKFGIQVPHSERVRRILSSTNSTFARLCL